MAELLRARTRRFWNEQKNCHVDDLCSFIRGGIDRMRTPSIYCSCCNRYRRRYSIPCHSVAAIFGYAGHTNRRGSEPQSLPQAVSLGKTPPRLRTRPRKFRAVKLPPANRRNLPRTQLPHPTRKLWCRRRPLDAPPVTRSSPAITMYVSPGVITSIWAISWRSMVYR